MSAEIPTGYRLPLVDEVTWELPTETMDAIADDLINGASSDSVAVGNSAAVSSGAGVAMGYSALSDADRAIAIGSSAHAGLPAGSRAVAIGADSIATGGGSVAIGRSSTASGSKAIAIGQDSVASGSTSVALPPNSISDQSAVTILSTSGVVGQTKIAQTGERTRSYQTNTNVPAIEQLPVADDCITYMQCIVTSRQQTGAVAKVWEIKATVEKVDGVARFVGSVVSTVLGEDAGASGWTAVVSIASNIPQITITGPLSTVVFWGIHVYHAEIRVPTFAA